MKLDSLNILKKTDELKKLIEEHPDYPIMVLCDPEVCADDYRHYVAPDMWFSVGEVLDCEQPVNEELVYTDRIEFEEDLSEYIALQYDDDVPDKELDKILEAELKKYESYWKNVIFIRATV